MPRLQLRIRWLMIAVAVAAGLLALPWSFVYVVATAEAIPAAVIALLTLVAPRERRWAVAFWAVALHPLVLLTWLTVARSLWLTQPYYYHDFTPAVRWGLEIPYLDVLLAFGLILPALFLMSVVRCVIRSGEGIERVFVLPPLWAVTWIIMDADPFAIGGWLWD